MGVGRRCGRCGSLIVGRNHDGFCDGIARGGSGCRTAPASLGRVVLADVTLQGEGQRSVGAESETACGRR
jgi:hypothetical protein